MNHTDIQEWSEIEELSMAVANASASLEEATNSLFEKIAVLEKKYGDHIDLLATKGDFARDLSDKVRYLERALHYPSSKSKMLAVSSLAEIMGEIVDFLRDRPCFLDDYAKVLALYDELLDEFPDEFERSNLEELRKEISGNSRSR